MNDITVPSEKQGTIDCQIKPQAFACSWEGCGRIFRAQFSLNRHMVLHLETKKYVCKLCQKGFSLPQYLREHEYTHTKELPYLCGVAGCTMRFRQAGKLSLHRRTHLEYQCKKYDYSLNAEKRTTTKVRVNQRKRALNTEEIHGDKFKVTKIDEKNGNTATEVSSKLLNTQSHGQTTEEAQHMSFELKPLPLISLSMEHLFNQTQLKECSEQDATIHHENGTEINQAKGIANIIPLMDYLNKSTLTDAKPILPMPQPGSRSNKHLFCKLDLFELIKNQEQ